MLKQKKEFNPPKCCDICGDLLKTDEDKKLGLHRFCIDAENSSRRRME